MCFFYQSRQCEAGNPIVQSIRRVVQHPHHIPQRVRPDFPLYVPSLKPSSDRKVNVDVVSVLGRGLSSKRPLNSHLNGIFNTEKWCQQARVPTFKTLLKRKALWTPANSINNRTNHRSKGKNSLNPRPSSPPNPQLPQARIEDVPWTTKRHARNSVKSPPRCPRPPIQLRPT